MDENTSTKKDSWMKRSAGAVLFILVLLTYFVSEALLRRTVYEIPQSQSADKTELIQMIPNFLQGYLKDYAKRVELKDRLKKTVDPKERAEILFELATKGQGEGANVKLLMKAIDEIPHSPDALKAWSIVLKHMSDEEILEKYMHYVMNCDVRRPRQKLKVWQLGALALVGRSKDIRLEYVKQMAKTRVVSAELAPLYEELWIESDASGELKFGRLAKELKDQCTDILKRKAKQAAKKK